ncbi:hypothetical protein [Azospirillum sp. B4]|uniref:hypothetical protein n=1 Tax=Azospirillum sp. B4 TaxID=95605 RepID=UPI00034D4571|nr:hypothetical protein [Azospirillum sp. B4]
MTAGNLHTVARVLAAIAGTYALAWGFSALGAVAGARLGMAPAEATTLFGLLALLAVPAVALWALATRRLGRTWAVLAVGGVAMTLLARGMAP